ncbi:hypothetical protein Tco_1456933 [Tanacetum coccineum]
MDVEIDEEAEEEHLAPAYPVVVALPATAPSAEETEPFETDESAATPPPHPAYRMTARITIPEPLPVPAWSDSEVARLLAISSPPASPLSPWSSSPPQIPFPLSPPPPVLTAPPPSPIRYEVGESSAAAAARPAGGFRADYGFVATMDRQVRRDPERYVGYGITGFMGWGLLETLQGAPERLGDEPWMRAILLMEGLYPYAPQFMHRCQRSQSFKSADLRRQRAISDLLETDRRRREEIRELRAADRTRQQQIIQTLTAVQTLQRETIPLQGLVTTLQEQVTALQGQVMTLRGQVTVLQGQQGPAGGPAQPGLPEDTGSSS